jgi:hypothetical protein
LEDFERGDAVLEDAFYTGKRDFVGGGVGGMIEFPSGGAKRFNRVVHETPVFFGGIDMLARRKKEVQQN